MDIDALLAGSSAGVSRFLLHTVQAGYLPIAVKGDAAASRIEDAFTIVYGVERKTWMVVYADKKAGIYPPRGSVKRICGLRGHIDKKSLLEQGLKNVETEMGRGHITPFLSEAFDISQLLVVFDAREVAENELVKFPLGQSDGNYFSMHLGDVAQALKSLYGYERVKIEEVF